MGGFTAVSNICDYINYLYPNIFYMELKSTATGTLPLNHISKNQKDGLTNKTKYDGVIPGVLRITSYNVCYTKLLRMKFFVPLRT